MLSPSQKSFWKRLDELGVYLPTDTGNKPQIKIAGAKSVDCYLIHLPKLFD